MLGQDGIDLVILLTAVWNPKSFFILRQPNVCQTNGILTKVKEPFGLTELFINKIT
jgi:hypothetical protein